MQSISIQMLITPPVYFSIKDISVLAKIIHSVLYKEHGNLEVYVCYLKKMNHFLKKLNLDIGVVWKTPSGMVVEQKYVKMDKRTIKTNILTKTKSVKISVPSNKVNITKQNLSILPNLVHSMDASNITLLVNNIINSNKNIDISTIHDCFASQTNNIELLSFQVKLAFLHIYKNQDFINQLHD